MLWNYSVSSTLAHIKCRCGVGCKHRIFSAAVGCISVIFFLSEMWAALQKQRWLEHMWVHRINSANITRWTGDIFTKSGEEKTCHHIHGKERHGGDVSMAILVSFLGKWREETFLWIILWTRSLKTCVLKVRRFLLCLLDGKKRRSWKPSLFLLISVQGAFLSHDGWHINRSF